MCRRLSSHPDPIHFLANSNTTRFQQRIFCKLAETLLSSPERFNPTHWLLPSRSSSQALATRHPAGTVNSTDALSNGAGAGSSPRGIRGSSTIAVVSVPLRIFLYADWFCIRVCFRNGFGTSDTEGGRRKACLVDRSVNLSPLNSVCAPSGQHDLSNSTFHVLKLPPHQPLNVLSVSQPHRRLVKRPNDLGDAVFPTYACPIR